jgi:hypothetical protein
MGYYIKGGRLSKRPFPKVDAVGEVEDVLVGEFAVDLPQHGEASHARVEKADEGGGAKEPFDVSPSKGTHP